MLTLRPDIATTKFSHTSLDAIVTTSFTATRSCSAANPVVPEFGRDVFVKMMNMVGHDTRPQGDHWITCHNMYEVSQLHLTWMRWMALDIMPEGHCILCGAHHNGWTLLEEIGDCR